MAVSAKVPNSPLPALAFIHTVPGLIPVFDTLARQHLPAWATHAMLDESLLQATIRQGKLSQMTVRRLTGMVWSAVDAGAAAIVVTCSTLGPAVDLARPLCPVPLFRIDEGMALAAVGHGARIGVLATLSTTLEPTSDLIRRVAANAGRPCSLTARLAEGAFDLLRQGDTAGHDRAVAESLRDLAGQVDVIVLAQASMARALAAAKDSLGALPVLTSPELGMQHIAAILSA
ncbi:Asp/Glu/hydantoin racemase [bacterium]|nr:Asp/Glu/hydantoin racemase [bacterium]